MLKKPREWVYDFAWVKFSNKPAQYTPRDSLLCVGDGWKVFREAKRGKDRGRGGSLNQPGVRPALPAHRALPGASWLHRPSDSASLGGAWGCAGEALKGAYGLLVCRPYWQLHPRKGATPFEPRSKTSYDGRGKRYQNVIFRRECNPSTS